MKVLNLFIPCGLLVFLVACQSSTIKYLTTEQGGVLFEDDFSNPPGVWPVFSTSEASSAFTDEKLILWIDSPSFSSWILSGQEYENVIVEVDSVRLEGPRENMYGLTCRASEDGNFYFFIISSDGYYAIGIMQEGGFSLLGQDMMAYNAAILPEGANHLRFDCINSTLSGYVNGQMVAVTGDGTFTSGDTGVIAGSFDQGGVVVSFDNFIIYKP